MEPIIVNARGGGFAIYMRPAYSVSVWRMNVTRGTRYDPIERQQVTGGVPSAMERLPHHFPTMEAALSAIATPSIVTTETKGE